MKHLILILLITISSFANSVFFKEIEKIENKYYSIDANINSREITKTIDEKYKLFDQLLDILKNKPYDLALQNSFSNKDVNKNKIILQEKIKVNQKYNYDLAVTRDEIELTNLMLQHTIYVYCSTLTNNWTTISKEQLFMLNETNNNYLHNIKFKDYSNTYLKIKNIKGSIENKIKDNFEELNKHYRFFSDFLIYIQSDKTLLSYRSFTSFLHLGILIDEINSNAYFQKSNAYLRFISIDMGRIVLFFSIVLLFIFINYLIYKKIYLYFENLILEDDNEEIDDILLENLNRLRKPIAYFIAFIGLKLSLEILVYPTIISMSITNIFYFIYIAMFSYVVFILIDNFLLIYLTKQNYKNTILRKELFALSASIIKIVISIVGILIFLLKLGIDISAILASLGIGGLAVAFAAQTTLSNFFGLVKMIFDKSFSQGDWIATKDIEGFVVEIGFISTQLRTFDNALITIPNSTLANSSIKNWTKRRIGRRIKMRIGVTYASKRDQLQKAIHEIDHMLRTHPDISIPQTVDYKDITKSYKKEQKFINIDDKYGIKSNILVYLDEVSDSSLDILIYAFSKTTQWDQWLRVKQDVIFKIWGILEKNNLEFAFPSRSLYLEKDQKVTEEQNPSKE